MPTKTILECDRIHYEDAKCFWSYVNSKNNQFKIPPEMKIDNYT